MPRPLGGATGGYVDASGTPSSPLEAALEHTDQSIGLMVSALARAAQIFDSREYLDAALTAAHFQREHDTECQHDHREQEVREHEPRVQAEVHGERAERRLQERAEEDHEREPPVAARRSPEMAWRRKRAASMTLGKRMFVPVAEKTNRSAYS